MEKPEGLDAKTLEKFAATVSVNNVRAIECDDGRFKLVLNISGRSGEFALYGQGKQGKMRKFADLTRLARFCRRLGIYELVVVNRKPNNEAA